MQLQDSVGKDQESAMQTLDSGMRQRLTARPKAFSKASATVVKPDSSSLMQTLAVDSKRSVPISVRQCQQMLEPEHAHEDGNDNNCGDVTFPLLPEAGQTSPSERSTGDK